MALIYDVLLISIAFDNTYLHASLPNKTRNYIYMETTWDYRSLTDFQLEIFKNLECLSLTFLKNNYLERSLLIDLHPFINLIIPGGKNISHRVIMFYWGTFMLKMREI